MSNNECNVEGCTNPLGPGSARGLCSKHYQKTKRDGLLDLVVPKPQNVCRYRECEDLVPPERRFGSEFCSKDHKELERSAQQKEDRLTKKAGRICAWCGCEIPESRGAKAITCCDAHGVALQNDKKRQEVTLLRGEQPPCEVCGKPLVDVRWGTKYHPKCKKKLYNDLWREKSPGYMREYMYNVSPERFEEILESQGYRCANLACRAEMPGGKGGWHVDHDHTCCPGKRSCGKCVRGLLCHSCSVATGNAKDDPTVLRGAADYLESHLTK